MKFLATAKGKQLFAAVVRDPRTPQPRRALAAWLKAKRDPLGDFILEQLQRPGSAKEKQLRLDHYEDWLGPLAALTDPFSVRFEGGFLRELSLGDVDGSYSDLTPGWLKQVVKAADAPQLALVETVHLGKGVGLGAAQALDGEGSVAAVTRTALTGRRIAVVAFLTAKAMRALTRVTADELAPNVERALKQLRPDVALELR